MNELTLGQQGKQEKPLKFSQSIICFYTWYKDLKFSGCVPKLVLFTEREVQAHLICNFITVVEIDFERQRWK